MPSLTIACTTFFKGLLNTYSKTGWLQMKLTFALLITFIMQVNAKGFSQNITFSGKDVPLEKLFNVIEEQTGYVVFYNYTVIQDAKLVTIHVKDVPLEQFLKDCFSNQELKYVIEGKTILVTKKDKTTDIESVINLPPAINVHGHVSNNQVAPMSGATVTLKGTNISVLTDSNGNFSISAPENGTLVISYIGYKSEEVPVNGRSELIVSIQELNKGLDEVVVMGYQSQKRSDITGSCFSCQCR